MQTLPRDPLQSLRAISVLMRLLDAEVTVHGFKLAAALAASLLPMHRGAVREQGIRCWHQLVRCLAPHEPSLLRQLAATVVGHLITVLVNKPLDPGERRAVVELLEELVVQNQELLGSETLAALPPLPAATLDAPLAATHAVRLAHSCLFIAAVACVSASSRHHFRIQYLHCRWYQHGMVDACRCYIMRKPIGRSRTMWRCWCGACATKACTCATLRWATCGACWKAVRKKHAPWWLRARPSPRRVGASTSAAALCCPAMCCEAHLFANERSVRGSRNERFPSCHGGPNLC